MPDLHKFAIALGQQMKADGSRSDVLRVLMYPIVMLVSGLVSCGFFHASVWVTVGLGCFLALFLMIYLVAFVFLLFNDRDALRSEKYSLQKLAIEQGLYGDSSVGLFDIKDEEAIEVQPNIIAIPESEGGNV